MNLKPVLWVGSAKRNLMDMPPDVVTDFGYALYEAQLGHHPEIAKPLKGFGGASVIELVQDHKGDAYRAVYTVVYKDAIIVLHVFKKKSKQGIQTPKHEIDLIRSRLALAETIYKEWKEGK